MSYKGLADFISILEKRGELVRVTHPVSTELEITEIVDRISKNHQGGKALLFENNGTQFPLLINAFGSKNRMALSLGCEDIDQIGSKIELLFKDLSEPKNTFYDKLKTLPLLSRISSWMPKQKGGRGECQEIIMKNPDLSKLPVLKCWPADGGPFITLPCVVTRDPETGIRNVGMYRMQIFDKETTGMHWHQHKTGARHYNGYKKAGKIMPVSVVLGGDPAYTYAATAPLPDNVDEYMLAGFLRNKKVELVKCITNDLEVPSEADFVIEGYVDPQEELVWEGPFGDHTGFYSLADWYPKFHVTCITHRKKAVYPATIVGIPPQEDAWIGKATERIFLAPMKISMIPELWDMDLPPAGVAHNLTIAAIENSYPGQAEKVMNAMWGAGQMMFNKIMIVTNRDSHIHDYESLALQISQTVDPINDIFFSRGPMDVLDHSSSVFAYGSKIGIDATAKEESKSQHSDFSYNIDSLEKRTACIHGVVKINTALLKKGISILVIGIEKHEKQYFKELAQNLLLLEEIFRIKFILLTDHELGIEDMEAVSWYSSGNIDPKRDCLIVAPSHPDEVSHLFINGTRKTAEFDGFSRDWPNPVLSSRPTIEKINRIWPELGIGEFIPSPSLKFMDLKRGDQAVALES
jgi:4-hydroxy-3-polyprenylbenzoate decarboxylase